MSHLRQSEYTRLPARCQSPACKSPKNRRKPAFPEFGFLLWQNNFVQSALFFVILHKFAPAELTTVLCQIKISI